MIHTLGYKETHREVGSLASQLEGKQLQESAEGTAAEAAWTPAAMNLTLKLLFTSGVNQSLRLIPAALNRFLNGRVWSECQKKIPRAASATGPKSIY